MSENAGDTSKPWETLPSLDEVEASSLDVSASQRLIARNTQLLSMINSEALHWTSVMGHARLEMDKLKLAKNTIVEINRALKTIVDNG